MNQRDRFDAVMDYRSFDRLPVFYFGTWPETLDHWLAEGLSAPDAQTISRETGMDPDWEKGLWTAHGLANPHPMTDETDKVLEETEDYRIVRTGVGAVVKQTKKASSIPHIIEPALKPTRKAWQQFKRFLDPDDPRRHAKDWRQKADQLNRREHVTSFLAGSLFGWPREWMGLEAISFLSYDDPVLYGQIVQDMADFFCRLHEPLLEQVKFDFAYFFEDCCCRTGPMFSPQAFEKFYANCYRRMTDFYRSCGVKYILLDSDGQAEQMIPLWLDSGIDIVFPIEIGVWGADPVKLRAKFGRRLRMMGGVNKHVIAQGAPAIRAHLEHLVPLAAEGGYIPLPDHRIGPNCSLEQFRTYVDVFKEVFAVL